MFPEATVFDRDDWDLLTLRPELRFDLIVVCREDLYSSDTATRLGNALASCRVLLLAHDVSGELPGQSGNGRTTPELRGNPRVEGELRVFGDQLLCDRIIDGAGAHANGGRRRLAVIRGALTHPLIRIDDYPTGIRPILPDLEPLHDILKQFEARALPYHLGIVPAILSNEMLDALRSFRFMIPAQHGFDHRYPHYSALLTRKRDPYNERGTVGGFNEFSWQSTATIERKLGEGKALLERELGLPVDVYIPPCNRCNRRTAHALEALGFRLCLSEKPVPGRFVPGLRSDFYGRTAELNSATIPEVLGLHVTWEWDLQRNGDTVSLPGLLDRIVDETRAKQAAIEELARECQRVA